MASNGTVIGVVVMLVAACGESSADVHVARNGSGGGDAAIPADVETNAESPDAPSTDGGDSDTPAHADAAMAAHADATMAAHADAAMAAHVDAAAPSVILDASAGPPPDCIPPCLWDLLKDCLPSRDCFIESGPSTGTYSTTTERCEPSTGWYSITTSGGQAGSRMEVYLNGNLCYRAAWGGASPVPGIMYSAATGELIATVGYDWTEVTCAPNTTRMAETYYPTRADCAPWIELVTPSTDCPTSFDSTTCGL